MSENPPDPPRSGEPPQPTVVDHAAAPSDPPPPPEPPPAPASPQEPGRGRRFLSHRATGLVAAGLGGLLIGAGGMALIAAAVDDDDDRRHGPRAEFYRGDDGPPRMKRDLLPGPQRLKEWKYRDPEALRERSLLVVPEHHLEHHHDKDGNMVPGPPKKDKGGN